MGIAEDSIGNWKDYLMRSFADRCNRDAYLFSRCIIWLALISNLDAHLWQIDIKIVKSKKTLCSSTLFCDSQQMFGTHVSFYPIDRIKFCTAILVTLE